MRKLTTKFTAYNMAKYEKESGKDMMSLFSVDKGLSISSMAEQIYRGNAQFKNREPAYEVIDKYLEIPGNNIITLQMDLLEEFDMDYKLFSGSGISIQDIRDQMQAQIDETVNQLKKTVKSELIEDTQEISEVPEISEMPA